MNNLAPCRFNDGTGKMEYVPRPTDSNNEKLHALYTQWACGHLTMLDGMLNEIRACSNLNLLNVAIALQAEIEKLEAENSAYWDARVILNTIWRYKVKMPNRYKDRQVEKDEQDKQNCSDCN